MIEVSENESVNFRLPNFFKNKKQRGAVNQRQKAAFGREMPYFWRWKEDIEILGYFLEASYLTKSTIQHITISQVTMIKKLFSTALFAFALTAVATAQRIAYVDVTAILESLPEYQKAQEQLDKVATQWRQEIAQEQDKVKGMYSKYQAEQVLLSEEMKKQREEEIMNKEKEVREMQRQKFGPEGALFKKREELVKPIQDKVYAAIQKFAEDKGYEFIFEKGSASGMLYADKRNDKTDDVKAMLKK